MMLTRLRSLVLPLILSVPLGALAGPFSSLFVFGDSLSDTGNLALISPANGPNPANGPYDGGRFSDGPLWIEGLASGLGLAGQAAPALLGGNNYAFAGARTGAVGNPPGVLAQAAGLWGPGYAPWGLPAHLSADPNALYVVVGGGNDMRDARSLYTGMTPADSAGRAGAAAAAIANLSNTLGYLASLGAKNILISTLPDLGFTPEANLLGLTAASADASAWFNGYVPGLMGFGTSLGLHMHLLDMAGLGQDIQQNPADFGITNTHWPCAGFTYSQGAGCDQSAFSDVLHPSALVGSLFARAALEVLGVPEPGTLFLLGLALLTLTLVQRRRLTSRLQAYGSGAARGRGV